jgi:hypothetical protein
MLHPNTAGPGNILGVMDVVLVTVTEWSKAWAVLARLDAGIVGSNPTRRMDVYMYVYVYSMFVLSCVRREVLRWANHSSKESYRMS